MIPDNRWLPELAMSFIAGTYFLDNQKPLVDRFSVQHVYSL
jgi:hypothetical protein